MIEVIYKDAKITGLVTAVRVEKNISAAGSEAEITAICSPGDRYLPVINPSCGEPVSILWNDDTLFKGTIEQMSFSADALSVTMLCYDAASILSKNEIYAIFSGAPSDIAAKVCAAAKVKLGSAWDKPEHVLIPASCAMNAHSIIRQAYGGQCVTECVDGKINILKPGQRKYTAEPGLLLSAWARHSVEGMVNSADIIGYMGRKEASARSAADIDSYGERRRIYSLSGARQTAGTQAKSHLSGIKREAGIKVFGVAAVKCGDCLTLDAHDFGIEGDWTVTSVKHEISGGFSSTALGLIKENGK